MRVEDAHGAPPTVPFWNGEAPGRTLELSEAVGSVREEIAAHLDRAMQFLIEDCGLDEGGAKQAVAYVQAGAASLNALPTQNTVVAERFFDEGGGMQLVIPRAVWIAHQPGLGAGAAETVLPLVQFRAASRGHR